MFQELAGAASVLGRDDIALLKSADGAKSNVLEIADGRRNKIKRARDERRQRAFRNHSSITSMPLLSALRIRSVESGNLPCIALPIASLFPNAMHMMAEPEPLNQPPIAPACSPAPMT